MTMGVHKDDLFAKQTRSAPRSKAETKLEHPLRTGRLVSSPARVASEEEN